VLLVYDFLCFTLFAVFDTAVKMSVNCSLYMQAIFAILLGLQHKLLCCTVRAIFELFALFAVLLHFGLF